MIDKTLENGLYDNNVYDAWQFVVNTVKIIDTVQYCKTIIFDVIDQMSTEHEAWSDTLISDIASQNSEIKKIEITTDDLPTYQLNVSNVKVSSSFLLNKLTKDFFQYSRNAFDSMSQIANSALLATKAKKVDTVDFPKMWNVFNQQTYSQDFPNISAWYNKINTSPEFTYIDAFNNRTKHTHDIYLNISFELFGRSNSSIINPFFRKNVQHDKQNIKNYMNDIFAFVNASFDSFLNELKKEYPKKKYVGNRKHKLMAYQQKMKDSTGNDFSVVYIEAGDTIENLPNEIQVLLLHKFDDGEICGKNCGIDTILVQESQRKYIGRYIADEPYGDDTLLKYRKYKRDSKIGQQVYYEEILKSKKKPIFYKINPFIDIKTQSDDNDFLNEIQIPF